MVRQRETFMKILLATDGSKFSEAATQFVASQFRAEGAEVLVLQVVEPLVFSTPPQMAPGYAPEMAERLQGSVEASQRGGRTHRGKCAKSRVQDRFACRRERDSNWNS